MSTSNSLTLEQQKQTLLQKLKSVKDSEGRLLEENSMFVSVIKNCFDNQIKEVNLAGKF